MSATKTFFHAWAARLSKVQGSQEKQARRISNTLSELRTQLTPQFAKSNSGVAGSAGQQGVAARRPGGFTTVELMVVVTVTSIMFLAFLVIFTNYFVVITKNNAQMDMTVNSQNLLRATVDTLRVGGGVRQSNSISDPNAPVGGWNTSNDDFVIVIASPALDSNRNYIINPDTGSPYMNELVYFKDGDNLKQRALANPDASGNSLLTSCPADQATSSCPADKVLAEYVKTMVFTLYDQDNNSTIDPLLAQSVKIDLGMERVSFGSTFTLDNSIRVTLRNRF